jgi:hypothetical protein
VDDLRKLEAKALARAKSRARRLRVSRIRSLTFRGSLALFLLLWAVVFVQLASGNDPALNSPSKKAHREAAIAREPEETREPAPEFEPEEVEEPIEGEPEFEEPLESEFEEPEAEFESEPEFEEPEPVITGAS